MKKHIKLFGITALLAVVVLSLISCGEMAEVKIKNDTSTTYNIKLTVDGKIVYEGQISKAEYSHSQNTGFTFRVDGAPSTELGASVRSMTGDVSPGDVKEVLLSKLE